MRMVPVLISTNARKKFMIVTILKLAKTLMVPGNVNSIMKHAIPFQLYGRMKHSELLNSKVVLEMSEKYDSKFQIQKNQSTSEKNLTKEYSSGKGTSFFNHLNRDKIGTKIRDNGLVGNYLSKHWNQAK